MKTLGLSAPGSRRLSLIEQAALRDEFAHEPVGGWIDFDWRCGRHGVSR